MKTLIFSDTHLGARTDKRLEQLLQLVEKYDLVIINGDFWDRFLVTFDEFLRSGWSKLFPKLLEKNAIYIYGNHDKRDYVHHPGELMFSKQQGESIVLKEGGKTFFITHGDKQCPGLEERFPVVLKSHTIASIIYYAGNIFYRKFFFLLKPYLKRNNKKIFDNLLEQHADFLICGHTHLAEASSDGKYYNSGMIRWQYFSYVEIIDGKIKLVNQFLNSDING